MKKRHILGARSSRHTAMAVAVSAASLIAASCTPGQAADVESTGNEYSVVRLAGPQKLVPESPEVSPTTLGNTHPGSGKRGAPSPSKSRKPPHTSAGTGPAKSPKVPGTPVGPQSPNPTTSPTTSPPRSAPFPPSSGVPGGLVVDESLIPVGSGGFSSQRVVPATYSKSPGDGSAAFRVNCSFSHMSFDDPIVFPGVLRATHLHAFFGNTDVTGASTPDSVRSSGNSTCTGGTANRSAYWAPAVIDTATGAPVMSLQDPIDREHALQVYYKTGYQGVAPQTVQNFPVGLRMIAGSASASSATGAINQGASYSCHGTGDGTHTKEFPQCPAGSLFIMSVAFPQCWDGVNLDSPDHKSHMAYGAGWPDKGCPASHPVPLPEITQNFRYRVPAGGMSGWRLSSDMYSGPAGYSGHADWMNGWDPAVFQRVVDNCYQGGFDCHMNLLGDGGMLL